MKITKEEYEQLIYASNMLGLLCDAYLKQDVFDFHKTAELIFTPAMGDTQEAVNNSEIESGNDYVE